MTISAAQSSPDSNLGARVRWGGSIVAVENRPRSTVVEVLGRPLKSSGAPKPDAAGQGRYRALFEGFRDPSEYRPGIWVTTVGTLRGAETGSVGKFPYTFPVVTVEHDRLWRTREEIDPPTRYPYYYDPWWGPWYGPWHRWHRHPYWW